VSIDQALLAALDLIYAAATDESLWPDVIRRIVTLAESQAVSFCVLDSSNLLRHPIFHYLNVEKRMVDEPRFMGEYLDGGMMEQDPTVRHIVAHPEQCLVRDSVLLRESEKDKLAQMSGAEFDKEYMSAMVKDHETDVKDFDTQSKDGNDADIKAFAGKTLPTLQEHLKMAQAAAQKVGAK